MLTTNNVRAIDWLLDTMVKNKTFLHDAREIVVWVGKGPTFVIVEEAKTINNPISRKGISRIFS